MSVYHSQIVCRNLKLLNFSFDEEKIPIDSTSFRTFFKVPRKSQFLAIIRFLLNLYDEGYFQSEIQKHKHPNSDTAISAVALKWFRSGSSLAKTPSSFFRVLGNCCGPTVLNFLQVFTTFVLKSKTQYTLCESLESSTIIQQARDRIRDLAEADLTDHMVYSHCRCRCISTVESVVSDLSAASYQLDKVLSAVNDFPGLHCSMNKQSMATGPTPECMDHLKKLSIQVAQKRSRLHELLQTCLLDEKQLSANLVKLTEPQPVLDARELAITDIPDFLIDSSEVKGECINGKAHGNRLHRCANALFQMVSDRLRLDAYMNGATDDDSVPDWCTRLVQRTFTSLTLNNSELDIELDSVMQTMKQSIVDCLSSRLNISEKSATPNSRISLSSFSRRTDESFVSRMRANDTLEPTCSSLSSIGIDRSASRHSVPSHPFAFSSLSLLSPSHTPSGSLHLPAWSPLRLSPSPSPLVTVDNIPSRINNSNISKSPMVLSSGALDSPHSDIILTNTSPCQIQPSSVLTDLTPSTSPSGHIKRRFTGLEFNSRTRPAAMSSKDKSFCWSGEHAVQTTVGHSVQKRSSLQSETTFSTNWPFTCLHQADEENFNLLSNSMDILDLVPSSPG